MTPAFLAAVVDTLLPGDSGGPAGEPPLPPGSAASIDLASIAKSHGVVFDAIAKQAVDDRGLHRRCGAFARRRDSVVERAMPDAFRALLSALLADYYESPAVLAAMGWRTDPPQPGGTLMAGQDPATTRATQSRTSARQARGATAKGDIPAFLRTSRMCALTPSPASGSPSPAAGTPRGGRCPCARPARSRARVRRPPAAGSPGCCR